MAHRDDVYGLKQFFVKKEIEKYPLVLYETTQWAKYIINTNMAANSASKILTKVKIYVVHQFSKQAVCWSSSTMFKSQGLLLTAYYFVATFRH